jgi:DNA topoisomerase-1
MAKKAANLVIVESPAKAKTINKYLGSDYKVMASVGHVRDLPKSAKGQPVPGVDIDHDFAPTYVVVKGKGKIVKELQSAAKTAETVWFATDLDREGEAIAWHLAQELKIPADEAKRVVFDAITKKDISHAFEHPRPIDMDRVNAQQARRILDRIVGYQASPLLWKKVAGGLSAGRVQSVAVRVVVEREREIRAFVPDESWKVVARLTLDAATVTDLASQWEAFCATIDDDGKGPTIKARNLWLGKHGALRAELFELNGQRFQLTTSGDDPKDLSEDVQAVAEAVGLDDVAVMSEEDPAGKGPAKWRRTASGALTAGVEYAISDITTTRKPARPRPPFITSTLQMSASNALGFGARRTMRAAQALYEGVTIPGEGAVGLITYMRTDSTHLSDEAIASARAYIKDAHGDQYLPEKPVYYKTSNKDAQEAHEAIRPTEASRHPDTLPSSLDDDPRRLYRLIWNQFIACQMVPAQWDNTAIMLTRSDQETGAVLRTTGRVLAFDGHFRVSGVPTSADEQNLPPLETGDALHPFDFSISQQFSSPPSRYTEAGLVRKLEQEGIGRPSTYAAIIDVIQNRSYVEKSGSSFRPTDLGEVVTDKLIEAFPRLMEVGYTREMEEHLDEVAQNRLDWVSMLRDFYGRFSASLERAHEEMTHAKAETQPAPYLCPECDAPTMYRFGRSGKFLSCTTYPDCRYAAPIDQQGRPMMPERVNLACPEDGSGMELRSSRFGKFLASLNYPDTKFVLNLDKKGGIKLPAVPPLLTELVCEKCEAPLNLRRGARGPWLGCSTFPKCRGRGSWAKLPEDIQPVLEKALEAHEAKYPQITLKTLDGRDVPEGTPVEDLLMAGGVQELKPDPTFVAPADD